MTTADATWRKWRLPRKPAKNFYTKKKQNQHGGTKGREAARGCREQNLEKKTPGRGVLHKFGEGKEGKNRGGG